MGAYNINDDGSITKSTVNRISNIEWVDYNKVDKGAFGYIRFILSVLFYLVPYVWPIIIAYKIVEGDWLFFEPVAIEKSNTKIRIFCNRKGKLGLYHVNRGVILQAKFESIENLPTPDYPSYILERNGKFCLLNCTRNKILFKGSEKITYLGDNTVQVEKDGKSAKYSLIGMCIEQ